MGTEIVTAVDVLHLKLLAYQVSMVSAAYLVESMTSSVISFAYFTHFSNLNIS